MPIHRLLEHSEFGPEGIAAMVSAYERVTRELTLSHGERRASNEQIALMIVLVAHTGECDASIIAKKTIARLHR